jgi:hypothetical protein
MWLLCLPYSSAVADDAKKEPDKHSFHVKYEVYAGGLHGVSAEMRMEYDNESYMIATWGKTRGVIGYVYPIKASYTTTGKITSDGALIPQRFEEKTKRKGREKIKALVYDDKGNAIQKIKVKKGNKTVTDIKDGTMEKGALDYQSLILQSIRHLEKTGECAQSLKMFDGDKNFAVKVYDPQDNDDYIKRTRYSKYVGKAKKCAMSFTPIGEYPDSWFWKRNGKKGKQMPIEFWLSTMSKYDMPIITKGKLDSKGYGSIIIHITSY